MIKSLVLAACILVMLILHGRAFKCYSCKGLCNNKTTCDSRDGLLKGQPPAERCLLVRSTSKNTGKITSQLRKCAYSYECNKAFWCSNAPENSTCEVGCCEGDLCNNDSFVPSTESKSFEPSGSNLSCYSCSDVPVNDKSIFKETTQCSQAPNHSRKCSPEFIYGTKLQQDRCLTLKLQVKEQTGEIKEMVVRNCSDALFCGYSNAVWTWAMSQSLHTTVVSAQASCCSGNLCKTKIDEKPTKGTNNLASLKTCSTSLLAMVVMVKLISFDDLNH